jgi:hypothetical protein
MVASLLVLVAVAMLLVSAAQEEEDGRSPQGSWMLTIAPPTGGPPTFNVLASFAAGGVFIASTQNDHRLPSAGIQQGTWHRTRDNEFISTELSFLYDPVGNPVGTLKVRATYSLTDAGELSGHGQLSRCDLNGANCVSLPGCATIQGKRIAVEAPAC